MRHASAGPLRIVYTGRFYDGVRTPESCSCEAVAEAASRIVARPGASTSSSSAPAWIDTTRTRVRSGSPASFDSGPRESGSGARLAPRGGRACSLIDAPSSKGRSLFLPSKLIDYLPLGQADPGDHASRRTVADIIRELGLSAVDPPIAPASVAALRSTARCA